MRTPAKILTQTATVPEVRDELPLDCARNTPPPRPIPEPTAGDRLKEALLRWLEQEM